MKKHSLFLCLAAVFAASTLGACGTYTPGASPAPTSGTRSHVSPKTHTVIPTPHVSRTPGAVNRGGITVLPNIPKIPARDAVRPPDGNTRSLTPGVTLPGAVKGSASPSVDGKLNTTTSPNPKNAPQTTAPKKDGAAAKTLEGAVNKAADKDGTANKAADKNGAANKAADKNGAVNKAADKSKTVKDGKSRKIARADGNVSKAARAGKNASKAPRAGGNVAGTPRADGNVNNMPRSNGNMTGTSPNTGTAPAPRSGVTTVPGNRTTPSVGTVPGNRTAPSVGTPAPGMQPSPRTINPSTAPNRTNPPAVSPGVMPGVTPSTMPGTPGTMPGTPGANVTPRQTPSTSAPLTPGSAR
ncbi:hypothetical protein FACS1894171_1740 [Clostridia bacterium]|nr:hypothetical protein FACS1894171_1740 [Clostridia bacterium]